jgi:hypothetical protein
LGDDNIDEILAEIEKPSEDRPMSGSETEAPAAPETPAPPSTWNAKEWEFDWNGKKIAPDSREKLMTWASQGHNYSQRMAEVNKREREFQSLGEKYKGFDRYSEIDQFAKSNPEWWKFVESQWHQRSAFQPGGEAQPLDPRLEALLTPLQQKIEQLSQWKETAEEQAAREAQERQDKALEADIQSIRDAHPTIDFDAVDETGRTLESRICAHGAEIGTTSFRAAFRDYLHDQLVESAKAQSLAVQTKTKTAPAAPGTTTVTSTPRKPPGPAPVKGKSWDDVTQMALRDHGIN